MSEETELIHELRSLRTIIESTANHVDQIRTKDLPDIRGALRDGERVMQFHHDDIKTLKGWRDSMVVEFWKAVGAFGVFSVIVVAIATYILNHR